ncbi:MAG: hypothetical protein KGQ49_06565, partial [Verrucomicrobia bacterium]|nr:hypothetical protein [Verrucomicrobiota bacterium]
MRHFLFFVMLCALTICGEYAITRPASNTLFLTFFSYQLLPWVWLTTVPLNLGAIWLYNRFLPKVGPLRMMGALVLLTMLINTLTGALYPVFPACSFFQFAWKDIYILLMLKQLWSMIHSTIASEKAKIHYSVIYLMGAVGGIAGSLIPGFLASHLG